MAKGANLKVNMTADNSDLVQKAKESKKAVQDFEKVGSDALSKLGEAFGINTDKIELLTSALEGLGEKLKGAGGEGTKAFGTMLTSVSAFAAAVVALPLAGAIAGFKVLKEEAEAFKNTVEGANIELSTNAYVETYKQFLRDSRQSFGEEAAKLISESEKTRARTWGNIKGIVLSGFFGPGAGNYNTDALLEFRRAADEAAKTAEKAEQYQARIYRIQLLISDGAAEWAEMEKEIAEYKKIAYDKTVSISDRQTALAKVNELILTRYEDEAVLRERLANMQEKMNGLVSSSVDDIDKQNQLRAEAESVVEAMNNALRETGELQATLAAEAQKEAEARQAALAAMQAMAAEREALKSWGAISEGNTLKESLPGSIAVPDAGIAVPVTPVLDTEAVADIANELESILTSAFESIGASLGSLIGDLVTGGDAWSNFSNNALSAFGDMATSVGKMAISIGVAALAIQGALVSLNGWVAIAAGTALVALGAAVKAGMSNIASGNYSASASVATSGNYGSSTIGTTFDEREVRIEVSGELYGSGNQLVAVIENEKNRRNHTT